MELQKRSEHDVFAGPVDALLPGRRLRMGRRGRQRRRRSGRQGCALRHQRAELRPLQDLRHQGSRTRTSTGCRRRAAKGRSIRTCELLNPGAPWSSGGCEKNALISDRNMSHESAGARQAGCRFQREGPREGGWFGRRARQRQDGDEPVRRDRGRRGDPAEGSRQGRGDHRRLDRPAAGAGNAAHRARHGRRPRHPGQDRRTDRAARRRQGAEGRGRGRDSPAWSSSASRRSTTIPTRPARCWPRCSAGRRAPSPPRS